MVWSREGVRTDRGNSMSKGSERCLGTRQPATFSPSHLSCTDQAELCPQASRSLALSPTAIPSAGGGP